MNYNFVIPCHCTAHIMTTTIRGNHGKFSCTTECVGRDVIFMAVGSAVVNNKIVRIVFVCVCAQAHLCIIEFYCFRNVKNDLYTLTALVSVIIYGTRMRIMSPEKNGTH